MGEGYGGDQVDQLAKFGLVDLQAGVLFVEYALEFGVVGLNRFQGVID